MNFSKIKSMRFWVLVACGVFLAFVLFISSCKEDQLHFSHNEHVQKLELECSQCHAGTPDGVKMGAPSPDVCGTCHEEAKDAAKLDMVKESIAKWPRLRTLPPDGIFSHKAHTDAKVDCTSCHNGIAKSRKVTKKFLPMEKDCLQCHKEKGVSTNCSTCHKEISRNWPPPDHKQAWDHQHGSAARDPIRGDRCFRCHEQPKCDTCHKTEKPFNHGTAWREFGHGAEAGIDRSRCQTCHQTDYCIRCHSYSPPRSHIASWGPPSDRHCLGCHLGYGDAIDCFVCHTANIQHRSAPPKPAGLPHTVATNCRNCHKGFLLQHPDNGDNCRFCHK